MDDGHPIIRIVIFIILLLINAAFTGTEVAVSAVNESVLNKKKDEGDKKAARILQFIGQPAAFMSTIDLISAAVTIIAGAFVARPFFHFFHKSVQNFSCETIFITVPCQILVKRTFTIRFRYLLMNAAALRPVFKWCSYLEYFSDYTCYSS